MPTINGQVDGSSITPRFLKHVLPPEGWHCAAIFDAGRVRHSWHASIDDLAASLVTNDAQGLTAYHACAAYQVRGSRKQANARAARSFWLDIDAGQGKPYLNARDAFQDCERFRSKMGLPQPVYVASGQGVHAYWPLVSDLDPYTWQQHAEGLKAACHAHQLHAGPERTADIASILRPPGTHHRKGIPKLVECGPLVGPYQLEQFDGLLKYGSAAPVGPGGIGGNRPELAAALADVFEDTPRSGRLVADACRQLGQLRATRGNINEPLWYACLGVLAFCKDGRELAHTWSGGHPNYTERETSERLARRERLTGATTCEHFHSLDPKTCEACPHFRKINSPISLGKKQQHERPPDAVKKHGWNDTESSDSSPEPTQREKLILIGLDADLWHDKEGNTFATVEVSEHAENFGIKSTAFRNWLTLEYGERYPMRIGNKTCPSAPGAQALTEAIGALNAKAARGRERQAAIRIAEHGGLIYIDLGQSHWNAVETSPGGWRLVDAPPVRFIRPKGLRPLPTPVKGGHIAEFNDFLNTGSVEDLMLAVAWLVAALRPTGPYPVMIVNGEHGAGKSIFCRVVRRLVDPNAAELRSEPRDERDLLLAAKNGWVVALDNLSYVKNDLSDAVCALPRKAHSRRECSILTTKNSYWKCVVRYCSTEFRRWHLGPILPIER
jgi:hypothetical protein